VIDVAFMNSWYTAYHSNLSLELSMSQSNIHQESSGCLPPQVGAPFSNEEAPSSYVFEIRKSAVVKGNEPPD